MILLGEVKDVSPTRTGHRLIVKHMPDFPLILDEGLHRRLQSRCRERTVGADNASTLMMIATFGLSPVGLANVEELGLMVVAENWVPYESAYEKKLIDALAKVKERSVKGLRYNLSADKPTAAAVLQREPLPLAFYIVPPSADEDYEKALRDLIALRPGLAPGLAARRRRNATSALSLKGHPLDGRDRSRRDVIRFVCRTIAAESALVAEIRPSGMDRGAALTTYSVSSPALGGASSATFQLI
jgi:hypothetical protein